MILKFLAQERFLKRKTYYLADDIEEMLEEQAELINICAQFACYLKNNAIIESDNAIDNYLHVTIKEKEMLFFYDDSTIEGLKEVARKYEHEKRRITSEKKEISEPGEVEDLQCKLCHLKHNGDFFRDSFRKCFEVTAETGKTGFVPD